MRVFHVDPVLMSVIEKSPSTRSRSSLSNKEGSQEHLDQLVTAGGQIDYYIDDAFADSSEEDEDGAGSSE